MKLRLGQYSSFEAMLIAGSIGVFAGSAYLYFGGVSLQGLLFGSGSEKTTHPIGRMGDMKGRVLLHSRGEVEFKRPPPEAIVHDNDTIFTGSDGAAIVLLDGEGRLDLAKNTLVRLTDEASWSLGGVSRAMRAQVVAGEIAVTAVNRKILVQSGSNAPVAALPTGQAQKVSAPSQAPISPFTPIAIAPAPTDVPVRSAPPFVSPSIPPPIFPPPRLPSVAPKALAPPVAPSERKRSEILVTLMNSELNEPLQLPEGSKKAALPLTLRFKIGGVPRVLLSVKAIQGQANPGEIARKIISIVKGEARLPLLLTQPGRYQWVIERENAPDGTPAAARGNFSVNAEFQGIRTLEPVAPEKGAPTKHKYSITLRWTPFPGSRDYQVQIARSKDFSSAAAKVLQARAQGGSYVVERDVLLPGKLYYRISSELPGGFLAVSDIRPFVFVFSSPRLGDKAQLSVEDVLVTWGKSEAADEYEIEISKNKNFKKSFVKERVKDNLYVLHGALPGNYWWRVRTVSDGVLSPPEPARQLVVTGGAP